VVGTTRVGATPTVQHRDKNPAIANRISQLKPDRKQPARAPAMPARHSNQKSSQAPLQSQDWYVIADEGELTLRISDGLRVGEDRWGELTLNHPLSAHRWLEFSIDADGELWCRSSRKDIALRSDGEIQEEVMLDTGVPIKLPHNLLHISNHISRGSSSNWQLEVGLLEPQDNSELGDFDDLVDTQADVTQVSEPEHSTVIQNQRKADIDSNLETVLTPPGLHTEAPDESARTFIPTLETVVVAPRDIASEEAGAVIERAVAKLKDRSKEFGGHHAFNVSDSTESALVPVDAAGPFHTDEIRAALHQPINVGEPGHHRTTSSDQPIYSPSVTTSIVAAAPDSRLRLLAGFAITLLLILGAALLVAISAAPDDQQQRSLASGSNSTTPIKPTTSAAMAVPDALSSQPGSSAQPNAGSRKSRTNSLLKTASALLSSPADLQSDTLDFAIRSLNLVLAAQPQNLEAQGLLASAEQFRIDRNKLAATPRREQSSVSVTAASSSTRAYRYSDPRLANAARLIAQGAILAPRGNSAVALIMSVLEEDPSQPEAVRLLNRSASVLVAQADEEHETLGVYAARNTLEEVLSFHPNHGPANQRWRAWVATDSPMNSFPQVTPAADVNLEGTP
jgi:hypothetical protein